MTASSTTGPGFSSIGAFGGTTTAAYTANSHNFIPPTTQNIPLHQAHVYVEHTNGAFVPLGIHAQIESKQHMDQVMASRAVGGGGTAWNFHEDAKDYVERLETLMKFLRRSLDMLSGFACGFSMFKIMDVYTSATARTDEVFLAAYAHSSAYIPKCYLLLCLLLVVLSLLPMGFDLAMQSLNMLTFGSQFTSTAQRTTLHQRGSPSGASGASANLAASRNVATSGDGTASGGGGVSGSRADQSQQSGTGRVGRFGRFAHQIAANTYHRFFRFLGFENPADSPLRHLIQVRFVMFVAALGMTILEISIVDQRYDAFATSLTSSDIDRLHAATLTRAGLFAIAWLFSLKDF